VAVFIGEGEEDVKGGGRKRVQFSFRHGQSMIDITMSDCIPSRIRLSNRVQGPLTGKGTARFGHAPCRQK
jgi:hypothetical protein